MNKEQRKADYLAGFMASGEGYNGERLDDLENDEGWLKERDKTLFEIGLTGEELRRKHLTEHPRHPRSDWRHAVSTLTTEHGYWDWAAEQLE